jgi:hypothetical protein
LKTYSIRITDLSFPHFSGCLRSSEISADRNIRFLQALSIMIYASEIKYINTSLKFFKTLRIYADKQTDKLCNYRFVLIFDISPSKILVNHDEFLLELTGTSLLTGLNIFNYYFLFSSLFRQCFKLSRQ